MCRVTKEPGMQRRPYAEGEFSWADVQKMCRVTKEPGMQRRPYAEGEFSWADVLKNVPGYEGTPAKGRKAGMSNDEIRL